MVQRPFSETGKAESMMWRNSSDQPTHNIMVLPGLSRMNPLVHKMPMSKVSTILSAVDTNRRKAAYDISHNNVIKLNEQRLARNSVKASPPPFKIKPVVGPSANHSQSHLAIDNYYAIPTNSKFFPSLEEQELQSIESKSNSKENTIIFPNEPKQDNKTIIIKSIFSPKKQSLEKADSIPETATVDTGVENDKVDFILLGNPVDSVSLYTYNASLDPYSCPPMAEAEADIDAQKTFATFDNEPLWVKKKQFWNAIFDSRYEALMRSSKWPPLKVILVPRTHVDSIWKKSFEQYHIEVRKILSNVVKKLQFYSNLTFTWNEVSHLSKWWKNASLKSRIAFRKLLKSGRLEITTGAWVQTDEATTDLFGMVHLLVQGLEWLKMTVEYTPSVGWLTSSVAHSPTMAYLLSACDVSRLVLSNLHYSWEHHLAEYQHSDFIWVQRWDSERLEAGAVAGSLSAALGRLGAARVPRSSVLTHWLQWNTATFRACGPSATVCTNDFDFAKASENVDINSYNVKQKSELLLEQYSKSGTLSTHNAVLAPLGGPLRYSAQSEFDYQYNNYRKIADFVNSNRNIYKATVEFGTPNDYFKTIERKHKNYPTLKGDFLNFADVRSGSPSYWAGYFTSRPFFKTTLRRLESTLRTTEMMISFALGSNVFKGYNASQMFEDLVNVRDTVARLLDKNVASATLPVHVLRYAHDLILETMRNCWRLQELVVSFLSSKPGNFQPHLQKYVYRDGEIVSAFRTLTHSDQIYIFNSLSRERTEIVEFVTRSPNVRLLDHNKKEITIQINPIWKYSSDNLIKISRTFFKIVFAVLLPPMSLELYTITQTYDARTSASSIFCSACIVENTSSGTNALPFTIYPIETGDIQIESFKHRLLFDEVTGFLKKVVEKQTNTEKNVVIDFGAFRDASVNSGMFLFNTNVSSPLVDVLRPFRVGARSKLTVIVSGQITTELTSVYGRLLQHTVKIFNFVQSPLSNAIYVESKVDYEASPKHREMELFMSIQTGIANGNPPRMVTDNNGFQFTARSLNVSVRIESNVYPVTSSAFIQDRGSRLTYVTDHAQGVTALQEGQLVVLLDRRVLFDDGRGAGEGLAALRAARHRQYILLENFLNPVTDLDSLDATLPSFTAVYLARSLSHPLDIFVSDRNRSECCHFTFLPLVKSSFPCDVSVVTFRLVLDKGHLNSQTHYSPNAALLILHRQSFSCKIDTSANMQCNGESTFSLDKIFRGLRAAYQTNLAGTNKGVPLLNFTPVRFAPMELTTIKVYF